MEIHLIVLCSLFTQARPSEGAWAEPTAFLPGEGGIGLTLRR